MAKSFRNEPSSSPAHAPRSAALGAAPRPGCPGGRGAPRSRRGAARPAARPSRAARERPPRHLPPITGDASSAIVLSLARSFLNEGMVTYLSSACIDLRLYFFSFHVVTEDDATLFCRGRHQPGRTVRDGAAWEVPREHRLLRRRPQARGADDLEKHGERS